MARRKKNRLLQHAEYALYRLIVAAVRQASDDTVLRWGSRFGTLAGKILRGRDRLAMRNLRDTFPEKSEGERREILDKCWRHFGREMLGYVRLQSIPPGEVLKDLFPPPGCVGAARRSFGGLGPGYRGHLGEKIRFAKS